jgi:Ca2+-binding RTX toxin-like protein
MSRRPRHALAAALATLVVPAALPATAPAAVGDPYRLVSSGGGTTLTASPAPGGSTLVVQALKTGLGVEFSPAAVTFPVTCSNAMVAGRTLCPAGLLSTRLEFTGTVVEAGARDVTRTTVAFPPTGGANDAFGVDTAGAVGTVAVSPGAGADSVTVAGAVGRITLVGADPGDDRYDIRSPGLAAGTLALGAGNDVAASVALALTLDGGSGDDTLSGASPLLGADGNDLLEPTRIDQTADGGAGDDRLSFDLLSDALFLTKSGTSVQAGGVTKTGIERLEGGGGNDTIVGDGGPDSLSGGDGNDTIEGHGGGDTLDGGPGDNVVSYASAASPVNVDLAAGTAATAGATDHLSAFRQVVTGPGDDTVLGTAADEIFTLGEGADAINAGPGSDTIVAGPGDDLLRGGHGTDFIDGGPGRDTATYDERTVSEPVSVTLATPGDEGAPGENDTLAGIEDVVGGASSDVLGGNDEPNALVGGGGLNTLVGAGGDDMLVGGDFRDVISGGPGSDVLLGGGDDDSIDAFDGEADIVDCGASVDDDAQVDATDQVSGCVFSLRGDVPVPVDADGDGTVAGFDCDDANPAVGLTATDIPGDGIDQNCDGFDEPLGLVASGLQLKFAPPTKRGTRITKLVLTGLDGASTLVVTCRSPLKGRCPFTRATRRPARAGAQISLTALLKRRVLAVGTTIEVRITAPGVIGRVRRFTVRPSAALRAADLCVLPGSSVARKCQADLL